MGNVTKWLFMGAAMMLVACGPSEPDAPGRSGQTVVSSGVADLGGPFTLVDTTGAVVTEATLTGKPHLVYFGFAFCPDICPTALSKLGSAESLLGARGTDIGYVFITVDPERDTPESLAQYVTADPFPRALQGFTGTPEQVQVAKDAYKIFSQKVSPEGGAYVEGEAYTVDHADLIFLLGPDGKFVDFFSSRSTPQDIAIRVRQLLMEKG
jgi:protein SCO1/2